MLWAAKSAKFGFKWKVRDGTKIRFWEDHWFGNSSLAIQSCPIYILVNEKNVTIFEAWDEENLKLTL